MNSAQFCRNQCNGNYHTLLCSEKERLGVLIITARRDRDPSVYRVLNHLSHIRALSVTEVNLKDQYLC